MRRRNLAQCGDADEVGVMLFNHETHLLQAPIACTAANRKKLSAKLKAVTPGGGWRLAQAHCAGFKALEKASGASKALKAGAKTAISKESARSRLLAGRARTAARADPARGGGRRSALRRKDIRSAEAACSSSPACSP